MELSFLFLLAAVSFLTGVFAASLPWDFHAFLWFALFFTILLAIAAPYLVNLFSRNKAFIRSNVWRNNLFISGICLFFFGLGVWHFEQKLVAIEQSELRKISQTDPEVTLIGFVSEHPQERGKTIRFRFAVKEILFSEKAYPLEGTILVMAPRYPLYSYGEKLKLRGRLEISHDNVSRERAAGRFFSGDRSAIEGFNYNNYLISRGIEATIFFPDVDRLNDFQNEFFFALKNKLFSAKANLQEALRRIVSPPQGALAEALIFGEESLMSNELKDDLNASGLRHITAVSGMNITIISRMLLLFGLSLGLWRKHAFYFAVGVITLYIVMIGSPASAVRAGIMGSLFLFAQHVGRPNDAGRAIILAAAFMTAFNPLALPYDVGFQLSFLAILGIVYWEGLFEKMLSFFSNPKIFPLRSLVAMTLSAQIFTFPILLYNFGQISLVALITNLLVVPLLPLLTILSFLAALFAFLFPLPISIFFVFPVWLLFTYMASIVQFFPELPFATLRIVEAPFVFVALFYVFLCWLTWRIHKKQKLDFLNYPAGSF